MYQQVDGLAIGAPTSGFLADIFMFDLEKRALETFTNPPRIWWRFVDDVYAGIRKHLKEDFQQHMNNQHPKINFTREDASEDLRLPFLDTETKVEEDRSLSFKIYRKPTHTDQYLDYRSNHHISQKIGIAHTLKRRNERLVTKEEERKKENITIKTSLKRCGYPNWTLEKKTKKDTEKKETEKNELFTTIPYVKTVSEKLARVYKKFGVSTTHKPTRTIKSTLCNMKEKVHDLDKVNAIYEVECQKHKVKYVGETERPLKVRGWEHRTVSHKDAHRNHTITNDTDQDQEEDANVRRSKRLKEKDPKEYKKMNEGEKLIETEGTSEPAKHAYEYQTDHKEGDMTIKAIAYERNYYSRGFRESVEIAKREPNLNRDAGRLPIYPILKDVLVKNEIRQEEKPQEEAERRRGVPPEASSTQHGTTTTTTKKN